MRRRDDARVHRDLRAAAEARDDALLQHAQQLGLHVERHVADLVEQDGAARGELELARVALGASAREGALLVAEELRLEQVAGHGGAVDADERLVGARARRVDGLRDDLLAGAALAVDEDVGVDGGRAPRHGDGALQARALADDVVEAVAGPGGRQALRDLLRAIELDERRDEAAVLVVGARDGAGRDDEAAVRRGAPRRRRGAATDGEHRPERRQLRDRVEARARAAPPGGTWSMRAAAALNGRDDALRVAREDAVADGVERDGELVQGEALLLARAQPAEGQGDVLGEQVGDGLVLLAELPVAAQLVGVEDAVDLAGRGWGRRCAGRRATRPSARDRRSGSEAARCWGAAIASSRERAPLVLGAGGGLAGARRRGTQLAVALEATTTRSASSSGAASDATSGRQRRLVGSPLSISRQDVEQDAQPVALEEGRADELDQVAHRLVELRRRPGWPARPGRAAALPHVLDALGERPGTSSPLVDADLEVGQRAVGRVRDVGERVDERAARPLEGLDAGDRPLGHHAVEDAAPEAAEARADGEAVAPRRGRAEHLLGAAEPRRRRVAGARRPRGPRALPEQKPLLNRGSSDGSRYTQADGPPPVRRLLLRSSSLCHNSVDNPLR